MFPRQAIYKPLLRQGLINFARVGTAVHCLPSMFRAYILEITNHLNLNQFAYFFVVISRCYL